jgi:hypothetical protein
MHLSLIIPTKSGKSAFPHLFKARLSGTPIALVY